MIVSAIIFVIKIGLRWRNAPRIYGPNKTIDNQFIRRSHMGLFNRPFVELVG
jgi:transposase